MPVHNADIAGIFNQIADLLEIEGANVFRIRAYRNAARVVSDLAQEAKTLIDQGKDLTELPGIGKDLSSQIQEIVNTGKCAQWSELKERLPPAITDLLALPGLGPKKVRELYEELNIKSVDDLSKAIKIGRLTQLKNFGAKTAERLAESIKSRLDGAKRMKFAEASQYAEAFARYLREVPGVKKVAIAGSYRRAQETVGDLDILVVGGKASLISERFVAYDEVEQVLAKGKTKSTVVLKCGLQVDLRVVAGASFGSALQYFTGSKAHGVAVRRIAQKAGLKLNEYGVFKGKKSLAGLSEESVYAALKLPYIEPELRENRGEIEAAYEGRLPDLIVLSDLKGDLHSHTDETDGQNSLLEMAEAAKAKGLAYLAISDHSQRLTVARGMDRARLIKQMAKIDKLNDKLDGITLLKSMEVDILEDGSLDLADDVLRRLDLVVASVHYKFNLPQKEQTERILRAMDNPYFTILAHPTGRLIGSRAAYDVDMERIIDYACGRGCFLELNSHPDRLDLNDVYLRRAKEQGVLISINSDAHNIHDFNNLHFGIGQARRGWLEKKDVLNTRTLKQLLKALSDCRRIQA